VLRLSPMSGQNRVQFNRLAGDDLSCFFSQTKGRVNVALGASLPNKPHERYPYNLLKHNVIFHIGDTLNLVSFKGQILYVYYRGWLGLIVTLVRYLRICGRS
jgi:hypothetical protein